MAEDSGDGGAGGSGTGGGGSGPGGGPGGDTGGGTSGGSDPDGTSAPSGFSGMSADRNSDPANDKGPDAPGYSSVDGSSYMGGPVSVPAPEAKPSLVSAVRGALTGRMSNENVALSVGMGLMTAAVPGVAVMSALVDFARELGLTEEPTSFADDGQGAGDGPAGGADSSGNPFLPGVVTVNPPVFLTVGGGGLSAAAASFTTPQGPSGDSAGGNAAPAEEGQLWPSIAAAALVALVAA